ncbi:MAG: hypothetical protein JNK72_20150 [Myxococcales bacterium]|nr:hypothetical protein [Myxococcales bacterium]
MHNASRTQGPELLSHGERRVHRSNQLDMALRYLLASQRTRAGLAQLCLATDEGVVIAWDGDRGTCEELAAYAPFLADGRGYAVDPRRVVDVDVHPVRVGTETLLLVLQGSGPRDAMATALRASIEGVARILAC